ncbi:MAG: signal peptide peptidase SppA [Alphaproteobacteria bacterium]
MSIDADIQLDRRRLKRRLHLWRALAIVALVAAAVLLLGREGLLPRGDHIARLTVSGLILDDRDRSELLAETASDPNVQALIVHVNSPGGTVVGGETLYHDLRRVAENKPVVAVMREVAASAGYMIALGTDRIFAQKGSITGSIGVLLQATDLTGMLEKLGITTEAVKSGPLKAVPSPLEPLTAEGREAAMVVVQDMFDMFVGLVIERRHMTREQALRLSDGRVYTGRQAASNGLIDEIGGEGEALAWLAAVHEIDETLPVYEIEVEREELIWDRILSAVAGKTPFSERVTLDGLISLWHPDFR